MCGQVAMVFSSVCTPPLRNYYSPKLRAWTGVICGTMLLLNLALLVFYPIALEDARIWMLFGIILLFFLRKMLGRRFIRRCFRREKLEKRFAAMYAMLYLLSILLQRRCCFHLYHPSRRDSCWVALCWFQPWRPTAS